MKSILIGLCLLAVGALILSPAIAYLDLDPVPGDFHFHSGSLLVTVPVVYSLCASGGLTLLYYFLKR